MNILDMKPPFYSDTDIETSAAQVLTAYEAKYGAILKPPVPIEDIITDHLGLSLEVDDFTRDKYFGKVGDDVLGFIDMKGKAIFINQNLDPLENPNAHEGRFFFTLGHETGHYCQHQDLFNRYYEQSDLFDTAAKEQPAPILCRHPDDNKGATRPFIEQHADKFSGCILMPAKLVTKAWENMFNTTMPMCETDMAVIGGVNRLMAVMPKYRRSGIFEAIKPLARQFKVSLTAMYIRLKRLGLLVDDREPAML